MVHKKSEYRLSYKWLPQNICQEFRESTADYRTQRRRSDLSHHSWGWQFDVRCDCEEEDESDRYLALPRNRMKHKMLVEEYQRKLLGKHFVRTAPTTPDKLELISNRGQGAVSVNQDALVPYPAQNSTPERWQRATEVANKSFEGRQRDEPLVSDRNQPQRYATAVDSSARNLEVRASPSGTGKIQKQLSSHDTRDQDVRHWRSAEPVNGNPARLSSHRARNERVGGERVFRAFSAEPRRRKTDIAPVIPDPRSVAHRFRPSPVKRSMAVTKPKIPKRPFHSYGWANTADSFGNQRTHNILANGSGVHSSATAARIQRNPIVLSRPEHVPIVTNLQRSKSTSCLAAPVNHSSLWMTEYSRNFSKATKG